MLIPLYGRKLCTERFPELFQDSYAVELCERVDYDFSLLDNKMDNTIYRFGALEAAMRNLDIEWEVKDYLRMHPKAAVVNLGCGLDQTGRSCNNGQIKIYNIDFPETIQAREELIPCIAQEKNISSNLTDHTWMEEIDGRDGAIFFAAGVFHYLTKNEVKDLILALSDRFPKGRLVFDTVGKLGKDLMMRTVLRNMKMKDDVRNYLYVEDAKEELGCWSNKIHVSARGYMLGYHDMKSPGVTGLHRFLARVCDKVLKMQIVRIDFE